MHLNKICPVCHQSFEARRKDQVYCTYYCRKKHHKETYYSKNRIVEDINDEENTGVILRQFRCKKCHELVTVVNKHDRRTIFCSPRCEKLYWKHPKKIINKNLNIVKKKVKEEIKFFNLISFFYLLFFIFYV